jgi:hypothetical protein
MAVGEQHVPSLDQGAAAPRPAGREVPARAARRGAYDGRRLVSEVDEFKLVLEGVALGTVGGVFLTFLLHVPTHRSWVLSVWTGRTAAVLGTRFAYRRIHRALRRSGALVSRMLIVGLRPPPAALRGLRPLRPVLRGELVAGDGPVDPPQDHSGRTETFGDMRRSV